MPMQFPKGKFVSLVKVGEKGQIVIPKGARELFRPSGWKTSRSPWRPGRSWA